MTRFKAHYVAITAILAGVAIAPAQSETLGQWGYVASGSTCSLTANQAGAKLIMLTNKNGATGLLAAPADQSSIDIGKDYAINITIDGANLPASTANAIDFGGTKVLYIGLKATRLVRDMPDGVAFRIQMGGKTVFDLDKSGSHDAFAAYSECSKKFGA